MQRGQPAWPQTCPRCGGESPRAGREQARRSQLQQTEAGHPGRGRGEGVRAATTDGGAGCAHGCPEGVRWSQGTSLWRREDGLREVGCPGRSASWKGREQGRGGPCPLTRRGSMAWWLLPLESEVSRDLGLGDRAGMKTSPVIEDEWAALLSTMTYQ